MSIINKQLQEYRGDTVSYNFYVNPSFLIVSTVFLTVKRNPDDTVPLISIEFKSTDTGADWANGIVARTVTGHNLDVAGGIYLYDLKTFQGSTIKTHYRGEYFLQANITDLGQISFFDDLDLLGKLQSTVSPAGASIVGVLASYWSSIITPLSNTVENVLKWLYENTVRNYTYSANNKVMVSNTDGNTIVESAATVSGNNISIPTGGQYQINSVQVDTDDIPEGSTNFYYTESRFNTSLSGNSTDDLTEGVTNLYYLDSRVEAYLKTILLAKGDIIVRNNSGNLVKFSVGIDNYVLISDSATTTGLNWVSVGALDGSLINGLIVGGIKYQSSTLPPTVKAGFYDVNNTPVYKTADDTLALTDTIEQSRQALDSFCHYTLFLDDSGNAYYMLYGEKLVETGSIVSVTGAGTTKTLTVSSTSTYTDKTLVLYGNDTFNGSFKISGGNGSTTHTFEGESATTGNATGTYAIYERIASLHVAGTSTAITTNSDIKIYTPSYGENGFDAGTVAYDPAKNGFYCTIPGLTGYRAIGNFYTDGTPNVVDEVTSHKSGRDKNDNEFYIHTSGAVISTVIRFTVWDKLRGSDYVFTDDGTNASIITTKSSLDIDSYTHHDTSGNTTIYISKNVASPNLASLNVNYQSVNTISGSLGFTGISKNGDVFRTHNLGATIDLNNESKWYVRMNKR